MGFENIVNLLNTGRWPHLEIPSRQMLWILKVVCFQFLGYYWLRHVRPSTTREFAEAIDDGISNLFQTRTGMDTSLWLTFVKERIRLPIKLKGFGLRGAADRRSGQYVGAAVQSIMPLIDRKDGTGCVILVRLYIPAVVDLLGADSFDHPYPAP